MGREGLGHLTNGVMFHTAIETVYIHVLVFWGIFSHVFMLLHVMQLLNV